MSTQEKAREILTMANLLAVDVDQAVRQLNEALAGWPSEPGTTLGESECGHPECVESRPCPVHADVGADDAATKLALLDKSVKRVHRLLRLSSDIAHTWASVRDTETSVQRKLAQVDATSKIWCENCALHGHRNVRTNGTVCEFCAGFKSDFPQYKQYPPKDILDVKASRRLYTSDVHRIMRRLRDEAKEARKARNKAGVLTGPDKPLPIDKAAIVDRQTERLGA